MKIDGKYFGKDGKCLMPIFKNTDVPPGEIWMGAHGLYEEVVILDNTPHVEK